MQPLKRLRQLLETLSSPEHYLFSSADFQVPFADLSPAALKMLLGRAVRDGLLVSVCRGLYLYDKVDWPRGMVLYHAAAKLRAHTFNYISLESALSDAGVISQVPLQWLTLISGGRSSIIRCSQWGSIEFIHTKKTAGQVTAELVYDPSCPLWRASVRQAIRDIKAGRRPLDLIDWSVVDELV